MPTEHERDARAHIMFKKILIANRGEIAVRVMRACREMGIPSVAVYSDVDRAAPHVLKADEAYSIGAAAAVESYLNISKILDVAKRCGADAIHPGYGFLSENAKFAQACMKVGIKFIGPSAASMEMMGSKTRARQEMEKAGVPFVPGTSRGLESVQQAREVAEKIGYPVMLKAAAGGGGKGMRLVSSAKELQSALEAARGEAQRAFGDDEVYLEKAILNPRHIEMQVLADEHGNTVYLGERECSIQRRHQKVLEEAPSPLVDPDMRGRMGAVAVRVAKAAGYWNAGTIEFLVDQREKLLFPGNEHAVAGGASGDGIDHRARPGSITDPNRGWREASVQAGGCLDPGTRDRMPYLCGRPGQQLLPQSGKDHHAAHPGRAGNPPGQRSVRRLDRAHRLRSVAG